MTGWLKLIIAALLLIDVNGEVFSVYLHFLFFFIVAGVLDEEGASMELLVSKKQWHLWLPEVEKHLNSTATVTNITQQRFLTKNGGGLRLFASNDSTLTFHSDVDKEVYNEFSVDSCTFHSAATDKVFTLDCENISHFKDLESLLFLGCKTCFLSLLVSEIAELATICKKCGRYEPQLFFTKALVKLKRATPKRHGENTARTIHALVPHHSMSILFPKLFNVTAGHKKFDDAFSLVFLEELRHHLSRKNVLEAYVTALNSSTARDEDISALSEPLYLLNDVKVVW